MRISIAGGHFFAGQCALRVVYRFTCVPCVPVYLFRCCRGGRVEVGLIYQLHIPGLSGCKQIFEIHLYFCGYNHQKLILDRSVIDWGIPVPLAAIN